MFEIFIMYTITLNGNSTELSCDFFPSIEVGKNAKICLIGLQTNNSIPNINKSCNQINFSIENGKKSYLCEIPTGSYELNDIEVAIKHCLLETDVIFELKANNNTLKCEMFCNYNIDFSMSHSIASLLGFSTKKIYKANAKHLSDNLVNITKINCIYIESNLVAGSFNNGQECHTIHEFYPNVPAGFKIIEIPTHLVFYSLNCTTINRVEITLKDQNDELIDLQGEPITVRLLIQDISN